jgi:hypothetical protein
MSARYIQFLLKPHLVLGGDNQFSREDLAKPAFQLRNLFFDFALALLGYNHFAHYFLSETRVPSRCILGANLIV